MRRLATIFTVIGVLATLGAIAFALLAWAGMRGGTYTLEQTLPSPNGEFVLVVARAMGGGAAGTCSDHFLLLPRATEFDAESDQWQYRVAWLRCVDHNVSWANDRSLLIVDEGRTTEAYDLRRSDLSGSVNIVFRFGELHDE